MLMAFTGHREWGEPQWWQCLYLLCRGLLGSFLKPGSQFTHRPAVSACSCICLFVYVSTILPKPLYQHFWYKVLPSWESTDVVHVESRIDSIKVYGQ